MANDTVVVIKIAKALIEGLRAETIEDVGVTTVPKVVAGGKTKVKFRAESGLQRERGAIVRHLMDAGISRTAARAVMLMHRSSPLQPRVGHQPVAQAMIRTNLIRRSQFLLNAARRLQREIDDRASGKTSQISAIRDALVQEERYYRLHLLASQKREAAASSVDMAAAQHGDMLGWVAVLDERTSGECAAAHGRNFVAHKEPEIGWPGAVHLHCRCRPGPPWPTGLTVYSVRGD